MREYAFTSGIETSTPPVVKSIPTDDAELVPNLVVNGSKTLDLGATTTEGVLGQLDADCAFLVVTANTGSVALKGIKFRGIKRVVIINSTAADITVDPAPSIPGYGFVNPPENILAGRIYEFLYDDNASRWASAGAFSVSIKSDATTTGADQTLTVKSFIHVLTNAALTSIAGITAPAVPQLLILINRTGSDISVLNDSTATAANRFLTGTGNVLSLKNGAAIWCVYDTLAARWQIVGGSGGNTIYSGAALTLAAGGTITLSPSAGIQDIRVATGLNGNVILSNTPFGATPPPDGTEIFIIGTDNDNAPTIPFQDVDYGYVGPDLTFTRFFTASLKYNASLKRYLLKSRSA